MNPFVTILRFSRNELHEPERHTPRAVWRTSAGYRYSGSTAARTAKRSYTVVGVHARGDSHRGSTITRIFKLPWDIVMMLGKLTMGGEILWPGAHIPPCVLSLGKHASWPRGRERQHAKEETETSKTIEEGQKRKRKTRERERERERF